MRLAAVFTVKVEVALPLAAGVTEAGAKVGVTPLGADIKK